MVTDVLADADPRGDQRLHAASVSEKDSHASTSQSGRPQGKPIYTCVTETVNPNTVVFSKHCCLLGLEWLERRNQSYPTVYFNIALLRNKMHSSLFRSEGRRLWLELLLLRRYGKNRGRLKICCWVQQYNTSPCSSRWFLSPFWLKFTLH